MPSGGPALTSTPRAGRATSRSGSHLEVHWRPLAAGELDHERLWLLVTLAASALAAVSWQIGLRPPPCFFHQVTGLPCPGCGSTRAVVQLAQGHIAAAFIFNPLTTLAAFALGTYCLYATVVLASGSPRLRLTAQSGLPAGLLRTTALAALVANWWWVIAHSM